MLEQTVCWISLTSWMKGIESIRRAVWTVDPSHVRGQNGCCQAFYLFCGYVGFKHFTYLMTSRYIKHICILLYIIDGQLEKHRSMWMLSGTVTNLSLWASWMPLGSTWSSLWTSDKLSSLAGRGHDRVMVFYYDRIWSGCLMACLLYTSPAINPGSGNHWFVILCRFFFLIYPVSVRFFHWTIPVPGTPLP